MTGVDSCHHEKVLKRKREPEIKLNKTPLSPGTTAVRTHYSPTADMHRSSPKGKKEENHLLNLLPILQIFPFFIAANSAISSYSIFTMHKEELPSLSWWLIEIHHLPSRKVQDVFPTMHTQSGITSLWAEVKCHYIWSQQHQDMFFCFLRYHWGIK